MVWILRMVRMTVETPKPLPRASGRALRSTGNRVTHLGSRLPVKVENKKNQGEVEARITERRTLPKVYNTKLQAIAGVRIEVMTRHDAAPIFGVGRVQESCRLTAESVTCRACLYSRTESQRIIYVREDCS